MRHKLGVSPVEMEHAGLDELDRRILHVGVRRQAQGRLELWLSLEGEVRFQNKMEQKTDHFKMGAAVMPDCEIISRGGELCLKIRWGIVCWFPCCYRSDSPTWGR